MSQPPRIVFAGTPDFAVPTLKGLAAAGVDLALVLTQPDRRAGRGRRLAPPPVKQAAIELGIPVEQPAKLEKSASFMSMVPGPDLIVVVAYGMLLPEWLLTWPRAGCINVHASLLPRWRGAAPIHRAILAGDAQTGVSLMQMDKGLDTGAVHAVAATMIGHRDTTATLHERLARLGADSLIENLPTILDGSSHAELQASDGATYARKIRKSEAHLDWTDGAEVLERKVRAFDPWPVAFAGMADGQRLRIFAAEAMKDGGNAQPGEVVGLGRAGIDVATGSGCLRLLEVQPPSGRRMPASAYLAAHALEGTTFA